MKNFREPESWPHRPVYVKASQETCVKNFDSEEPMPLGVPIEFESSVFDGKILIRFRNAKSNHPETHNAYFEKRKRLMQFVVQGKFKKEISCADVFVGGTFQNPLKHAPPPFFARLLNILFERIAPGTITDLGSSKPRVLALYAGSTQTLSIDKPGQEPDIAAMDIPENTALLFGDKFKSSYERKRYLSKRQKASKYFFDTENIYTFHYYDDAMDYGSFDIKLPVYGKFDLSHVIGNQPLPYSVVTSSGEVALSFDCWHEKVVVAEQINK
jgi:hypothetical protein